MLSQTTDFFLPITTLPVLRVTRSNKRTYIKALVKLYEQLTAKLKQKHL